MSQNPDPAAPLTLAVISDSHLYDPVPWFEELFERLLARADVLVHCGDITGWQVLHLLRRHERLTAVLGNCDWQLVDELPPSASLTLHGVRIAATHGFADRAGTPERAAKAFAQGHDLVCYGHTHCRDWSVRHGARLLNPGSLSEGSLALVTVAPDGSLSCEFVSL
jgi:putative phosphoesterase